MAFTTKDFEISNKSYTNKDFGSVYTELVSLAGKISNKLKYDPTNTVETDPFIVLLKLAAFVGDKINYNVDKNILEAFMPSATQESSMQDLTSRLGYNMHYYVAPHTTIIVKYTGATALTDDYTIPKYSTVKDDSGQLTYVICNDIIVKKVTNQSERAVEVKQGTLKTFKILESNQEKISFENLDDSNRLYFSETMVAQNGVFIDGGTYRSDFIEWELVDNLNSAEYGKPCYVFRYDSNSSLPYIQFPDWINEIIGDGVTIKYIQTTGQNGNVAANALTTLASRFEDTESSIALSNFKIINVDAALNGQNPETIDEAYAGFKKKIGTFDTLVTCRDYANYIYYMLDNNENDAVSNVQVGDRRNDINFGCDVIQYSKYGQVTSSIITIESGKPKIDAFDLCLYPLKPSTSASDFTISSDTKNPNGYDRTFTILEDTSVIKSNLENAKTLSHNYRTDLYNDTIIFAIKNRYAIEASISTSYKVNASERLSIQSAIYTALAKAYNARNVSYGYAIDQEELTRVIEEADTRIIRANIKSIKQAPYALNGKNDEISLYDTSNALQGWGKNIVAKNLLAGKVPMFNYDEDFNYDYDQSSATKISKIEYLRTYADGATKFRTLNKTGFKLGQNEVVQFIRPNLINTSSTYAYGVNYYLYLSESRTSLPAGITQLKDEDKLYFEYLNSSKEQVIVKYEGTNDSTTSPFIYTKNELKITNKDTKGRDPDKTITIGGTEFGFYGLNTDDEVLERKINSTEIIDNNYKFYWDVLNSDNNIDWVPFKEKVGETEVIKYYYYILNEGDYFFYTDINFSSLLSYEAGTKIVITPALYNNIKDIKMERVNNLSALTTEGISSLSTYFKDFGIDGTTKTLTITEQEIFILSEGDSIRLNNTVGETISYNINDNYFNVVEESIAKNIEYCLALEKEYKPLSMIYGVDWEARILLDLNVGPEYKQILNEGNKVEYLTTASGAEWKTIPNNFFTSTIIQKAGSELIDVSYVDLDAKDYVGYPNVYSFATPENGGQISSFVKTGHYRQVVWPTHEETTEGKKQTVIDPFSMIVPCFGSNPTFIMFYLEKTAEGDVKLEIKKAGSTEPKENAEIELLNTDNPKDASTTLTLNEGMNVIKISRTQNSNDVTLKVDSNKIDHKLTFSDCRLGRSAGYSFNPYLDSTVGEEPGEFNPLSYIQTNYKTQVPYFYATAYLDNVNVIDLSAEHMLTNALTFYDSNNIANKWTIPQLDFKNIKIDIETSSRQ